jgi:OOP family OmpA-OmpF porin
MEASDANATAISANSTAINTLASGVSNALNFKFVESADVTFGFNKYTLTPEAKAALDQVASKMQSLPRSMVELAGFTDRTGSASYNLALSRRRAEAVQRYLVSQKVPMRNIHIVGMGKEAPPPGLEKDLGPNPTKAELSRTARRVRISIYGAGDITEGAASRSQE